MTQPIPDGLVCLTFDDGVKSQYDFAASILEQAGFGATFYISEGLRFLEDKTRYMTWEEIAELDSRGFEIGNHTRAHKNVTTQSNAPAPPAKLTTPLHRHFPPCARPCLRP